MLKPRIKQFRFEKSRTGEMIFPLKVKKKNLTVRRLSCVHFSCTSRPRGVAAFCSDSSSFIGLKGLKV